MKPLTSADCDLRDSKFMPVYAQALLNSDFNAMADDTAWRAGITLWLKAWHQVPAASLPDDDEALCALAGFGRDLDGWKAVRDKALRGWILCDDGRLYHPLMAEAALEAWIGRLLSRVMSAAGHARRWGKVTDLNAVEASLAKALSLLKALNPNGDTVAKLERRKMPAACQAEAEGKAEAEDSESSGFAAFREAYPAGHGGAAAGKAWARAFAEGHDPAVILAGLNAAKARWRKDQTPSRFIPLAVNWLDNRSWLNFVPAAPPKPWGGPPAVRDAVIAELGADGEAFARSYLDPAAWRPPSTLVARTAVAAGKLKAVRALASYRVIIRR